MQKIIHLLLVSLFFISCEIKVNAPSDNGSTGKVRNAIEVKEKGLKVKQAFLVFEDGKLVPSDNKVEVGQWVELRLLLDGWQEKDGKVFAMQRNK